MTILLDADGPLKGCDGRHCDHPLDELTHDPPPQGMFEPEAPADGSPANGHASGPPTASNSGRRREQNTIRRGR